MPYISTKTNIELAKEKQDALAAEYGRIISLVPGKTERWLMLSFDDEISMYFGGKGDEPMAYIELSLFGGASDDCGYLRRSLRRDGDSSHQYLCQIRRG